MPAGAGGWGNRITRGKVDWGEEDIGALLEDGARDRREATAGSLLQS